MSTPNRTNQSPEIGDDTRRNTRQLMLINWLVFVGLMLVFAAQFPVRALFGTDLGTPIDVVLVIFGACFLVELGAIIAFKHVLWIRKPLVQSSFTSIVFMSYELLFFAMCFLWMGIGGLFQVDPLLSAVALASAALTLWLFLMIHIKRFRASELGTCDSCGYRLVGDSIDLCPECGCQLDGMIKS